MNTPATDDGRSRVSRARAAATVVGGLVLAGALIGALWAWLAPGVHGVVALTDDGDRIKAFLGNESEHFFTAAALMIGMLSVLGLIAAVWVWQWRAHRGPVLAAALIVGSWLAATVAVGAGTLVARWRHGVVDVAAAPVSTERRVAYVVEAPSVFFGHSLLLIAVTVLFPAAVAALVYLFCAAATPRDDLGGWPPIDYPELPTGRIGTVADAPPVAPSSPSP